MSLFKDRKEDGDQPSPGDIKSSPLPSFPVPNLLSKKEEDPDSSSTASSTSTPSFPGPNLPLPSLLPRKDHEPESLSTASSPSTPSFAVGSLLVPSLTSKKDKDPDSSSTPNLPAQSSPHPSFAVGNIQGPSLLHPDLSSIQGLPSVQNLQLPTFGMSDVQEQIKQATLQLLEGLVPEELRKRIGGLQKIITAVQQLLNSKWLPVIRVLVPASIIVSGLGFTAGLVVSGFGFAGSAITLTIFSPILVSVSIIITILLLIAAGSGLGLVVVVLAMIALFYGLRRNLGSSSATDVPTTKQQQAKSVINA